jgi:hypothetical protein
MDLSPPLVHHYYYHSLGQYLLQQGGLGVILAVNGGIIRFVIVYCIQSLHRI